MKLSMIGQDIPMLLPSLLADLLFAGHASADLYLEERNPAMQDVLERYGKAIIAKSGLKAAIHVTGNRQDVLTAADCVIYAGDCMAASRFRMDRDALSGSGEDDPGLSDQARVNGGIGGLLHTLRAGSVALDLCDDMKACCPKAIVINLGQPMARITKLFVQAGFSAWGLGNPPIKGANGLEGLCAALHRKADTVDACIAGLPGFAFVTDLRDAAGGETLLPALEAAAHQGELGRLTARWLDWYGAVAAGDVTDHAELLPEEEDFIPTEEPSFGETVEQRKERILHMNTVGDHGADSHEGMMAQLLLLSKAKPVRPMRLALALLRQEDLTMEAVTRRNDGALPQLPRSAMIEAPLTLTSGRISAKPIQLPAALCEIMGDVDEANRLSALAATGDRTALRQAVENDVALSGLDRLYCQELVERLLTLHEDVLPRFFEDEA